MSDKNEDLKDKTRLISDKKISQEDQTQMLKTIFPGRTDAELVKINRNFLKDAVPFELSRLVNDLKKMPENMRTGFKKLDESVQIPNGAITIVTGPSKQGKSLFIMNMLFNMTQIYKGKHFLYYNYQEAKRESEVKFINLAGEKSFELSTTEKSDKKRFEQKYLSNLDVWKWKLKTTSEAELLQLANEDICYKGLMNFLDVSSRIHIIDNNYNIKDLIESIKLFQGPFIIGAVFIDFIQKIEVEKNEKDKRKEEQIMHISEYLRRFSNQLNFPIVIGTQYPPNSNSISDEKNFPEDSIICLNGIGYDASLIFDIKQDDNNNFLNVKVYANRIGPRADTKLKFKKNLMKITEV